jgi:hypothetical protein
MFLSQKNDNEIKVRSVGPVREIALTYNLWFHKFSTYYFILELHKNKGI